MGFQYPLIEGKPDALVICCADPRFQRAFGEFIYSELKIRMPMVISLPGVTSHFGLQDVFPKNWYGMRQSIETMTGRHKAERLVIINHDDCQGYAKVAKYLGGIEGVPKAQLRHAAKLGTVIQEKYMPNVNIELYQAKIVDAGPVQMVEFEKIT